MPKTAEDWNAVVSRNPVAATNALADTIAESIDLFGVDERLVWVNDEGQLVQINLIGLRELIAKYIVTRKLVNRGTAEKPAWEVVHVPFEFPPVADLTQEPSEIILRILMGVKQPYSDLPEIVGLLGRVPRA